MHKRFKSIAKACAIGTITIAFASLAIAPASAAPNESHGTAAPDTVPMSGSYECPSNREVRAGIYLAHCKAQTRIVTINNWSHNRMERILIEAPNSSGVGVVKHSFQRYADDPSWVPWRPLDGGYATAGVHLVEHSTGWKTLYVQNGTPVYCIDGNGSQWFDWHNVPSVSADCPG
jgi:hypothetical protein